MRRITKAFISAALAGAAVITLAGPASAAVYNCDVAGLAKLDVDIPVTASGPATVAVGETNRFNLELSLAGVVPAEFASLEGTANSAVASLALPAGLEVDTSTIEVTGVEGASVAINDGTAEITIPGPIPFGGGAALPNIGISMDVKATQAGEFSMTTEGGTAVLEAEAAITPGSTPIPITATCTATTPETLLTVSASEVATASQTAAPTATETAGTTATNPDLATTGSESTVLTGVALLMLGFGMLAVAGQRVVAYRRT